MFENVDGQTDDRRRATDAGVTGILIAHLGAFGSCELKSQWNMKCRSRVPVKMRACSVCQGQLLCKVSLSYLSLVQKNTLSILLYIKF